MATINYKLGYNPQWLVRDATGRPAIYGAMYTYRQINKQELKAVYQDAAGQYPYPNPIPLDGSGVVGFGQTGAELYFADDEPYYIQIYDMSGKLIVDLENYVPAGSGGGGNIVIEDNDENYFVNGQFLFNYTIPTPLPITEIDIADGGFKFVKNNNSATDSISFKKFPLGTTPVPEANPIYYLEYDCTGAGADEDVKDIIFRFPDVRTFENQILTFSLAGQAPNGATLEAFFVQVFGTGGSVNNEITPQIINLTSDWAKYSLTYSIPTTGGKAISPTGGDSLEFRLRLPLNQATVLRITNLQLELGDKARPYPYQTDEKTGIETKAAMLPRQIPGVDDFKVLTAIPGQFPNTQAWTQILPSGTILPYGGLTPPSGFLKCDGATYKKSDYPNLFAAIGTLWGNGENSCSPFTPLDNRIFLEANKSGAVIAPDVSTITGFSTTTASTGVENNCSTYLLGNPATPNDPESGVMIINDAFSVEASLGLDVQGTNVNHFVVYKNNSPYLPLTFRLRFPNRPTPGEFVLWDRNPQIRPTQFACIWYRVGGAGNQPNVTASIFYRVDIDNTDSPLMVAYKTAIVANRRSGWIVTAAAASSITGGQYWQFSGFGASFYVWYAKNGTGTDPALSGKIAIKVDVAGTDSAAIVAAKTATAILNGYEFNVPLIKDFLRGIGESTPDRLIRFNLSQQGYGNQVGTYQIDQHQEINNFTEPFNQPTAEQRYYYPQTNADVADRSPYLQGGYETRPANAAALYMIKS